MAFKITSGPEAVGAALKRQLAERKAREELGVIVTPPRVWLDEYKAEMLTADGASSTYSSIISGIAATTTNANTGTESSITLKQIQDSIDLAMGVRPKRRRDEPAGDSILAGTW